MPPTTELSSNDKDLLWKFRFSLFRSPRSLTKFLKCVTWSDPVEATQATEKLLPLWGQEVGMDDALELLGPGFTDRRVRAFAVQRLQRADDDVSRLETTTMLTAQGNHALSAATRSGSQVRAGSHSTNEITSPPGCCQPRRTRQPLGPVSHRPGSREPHLRHLPSLVLDNRV